MPVCFDTSLLVKLYVQEADSPQVLMLASLVGPIAFSDFHRVELVNALHLKQGRREITSLDVFKSLANIEADIRSGVLVRMEPDWKRVFAMTVKLSTVHTSALLSRTLDALHVAIALQYKSRAFATNDTRQEKLAVAAGLKVLKP
jgi:predicted nucleic acid-binding protein